MEGLSKVLDNQIPVKINVKTTIHDGNSKDTFELTAVGRYYKKGNARYLQYEEEMDVGMVKTIVKMTEDDGLILRSGSIKMRLPFKMHQSLRGNYTTPYGVFNLKTLTKRMVHEFKEETSTGSIDLMYDLNMQGAKAGAYHLTIAFEEEN